MKKIELNTLSMFFHFFFLVAFLDEHNLVEHRN